jgi:hypothetical protein
MLCLLLFVMGLDCDTVFIDLTEQGTIVIYSVFTLHTYTVSSWLMTNHCFSYCSGLTLGEATAPWSTTLKTLCWNTLQQPFIISYRQPYPIVAAPGSAGK